MNVHDALRPGPRDPDALAKVCLAISGFRSDEAVLELFGGLGDSVRAFGRVLVVESMASGSLERALAEAFPDVEHVGVPDNLGSAGNFALRLHLAAQGELDYVYACNHDGHVDPAKVLRLVRVAETDPGLGAVYPLRRLTGKGGRYDRAGERLAPPVVPVGSVDERAGILSETFWSSSNGSLYRLGPVRQGILPDADLWMGWEDLGFGRALSDAGWRQVVVNDVVLDDDYEYVRRGIGPIGVHVSDKPTWYQYYSARNLLLLARRSRQPRWPLYAKIGVEAAVIAGLRDRKRERMGLHLRGILDGLRGETGKWRRP